jgi:hypothetical protein
MDNSPINSRTISRIIKILKEATVEASEEEEETTTRASLQTTHRT